ncbi:MAG: rod shape-determining protein MreC [Rickettsiales bacterium]|nr:rod shape-determining protein MreC [Rickettsiales bacterium]
MKNYRTRTQSLVLPIRTWLTVGAALVFFTTSITLAILNRQGHPFTSALRHAISDTVTPVVAALSSPAQMVRHVIARIDQLIQLDEDNLRLRDQNSALLHWQTMARRLQVENETLRHLLDVKAAPEFQFVTSRVVTGSASIFSNTLLLNEGAAAGLKVDQAVITDEGLVGRLIEVGANSAQVLLITDINSRIPVEIEQTGEKAILAGDNSTRPTLHLANEKIRPMIGQRIVTAGDGGVFPSGFVVGEIASIGKNTVSIQPYVNASRLAFVRTVSLK